MKTAYEATFPDIEKEQMRQRLLQRKTLLRKREFLQVRCVLDLPHQQASVGSWVRLRHEGDRITLTLKVVSGQTIEGQKELELRRGQRLPSNGSGKILYKERGTC